MSETSKKATGDEILTAVNQSAGDVTRQLLALANEIAAVRGTLADHGAKLDAIRSAPTGRTPSSNAPGAGTGSSMVVKFGRDKGKRLDEVADLTWYREAIAKGVDDPAKAQWRERNLDDLAEIDREIARRTGSPAQTAMQTGGGSWSGPTPGSYIEASERPTEDDIPFATSAGIY